MMGLVLVGIWRPDTMSSSSNSLVNLCVIQIILNHLELGDMVLNDLGPMILPMKWLASTDTEMKS